MTKRVPVTISAKDLAAECDRPDYVQCLESYRTRSGFVFCRRNHGHESVGEMDHRGQGAQWINLPEGEFYGGPGRW